jgi:hypothetical protein
MKTDRETGIRVLAKNLKLDDRELLEKAYEAAVADKQGAEKTVPESGGDSNYPRLARSDGCSGQSRQTGGVRRPRIYLGTGSKRIYRQAL